jgi:O-antigen ligase
MFGDFPWLGAGFNAFSTAYVRYQHFWPSLWVPEVHNEYLQVLLDTGVAGALVGTALLGRLLLAAARGARREPLRAGIFGALLAECLHNLVDFNWQVPANAATFAALAGLAVQAAEPVHPPKGVPENNAHRRASN